MVNAIPHKLLKRSGYYSCPPLGGTLTRTHQKCTATVTALNNDVTEQTKLVVAFGNSMGGALADPIVFDACTGSECPIKLVMQLIKRWNFNYQTNYLNRTV
ncbi:15725_t:CDS:1 [Funneliformis mosseae]|uniref:15725_t:CDS:1 n=1 Tax=Funneliformis mosseae TaxID=27381 RepID=A0A9N9EDY9_FUNMO|nr:15725_t:CDS:1 [Funneliformis mosseae]